VVLGARRPVTFSNSQTPAKQPFIFDPWILLPGARGTQLAFQSSETPGVPPFYFDEMPVLPGAGPGRLPSPDRKII